jgi:formylglycine-generating enzyme required for sulfatase activity
MHGNVWQWVADCYHDSYANASSNGKAASEVAGCNRVIRGSSWINDPRDLRAAVRLRNGTVVPNSYDGFRVARTLTP